MVSVLVAACALAFVASCGSGDDRDPNFLINAAKNVTPAISGSIVSSFREGASSARTMSEWNNGNAMYELFTVLRNFNPDTDQGVIGVDNMYMNLWLAGMYYSEHIESLDDLSAKPISSPFSGFKTVDSALAESVFSDTYDQAKNALNTGGNTTEAHMAARETGAEKHMLITFKNGGCWTVLQGVYNGDSKDIELNSTTACIEGSYTETNSYIQRNYIKGNENTHSFILKAVKYSGAGYKLALVGKGISQGSGNYFLFKMKDSGGSSGPGETGAYYCFPASADVTALQAMSTAGTEIAEGSNCYGYKDSVDTLWGSAWDISTETTDVPRTKASFTNSSLQLNF